MTSEKRSAKCQTRDKKSCGTKSSQNGDSGSSTDPFVAIQEKRFFDNKSDSRTLILQNFPLF